MRRQEFQQLCREKVLLLDGATGTNLQKAGMPTGVCPEAWILEHPDVLIDLQSAYYEAGSDIVLAPTFTANRIKLEEYGLADDIESINHRLVALTKEAAGNSGLVAGDMTMTGQQLAPVGDLAFEELVAVYKEQAGLLAAAGADLFIVETMMSLNECRAAVLAIRETCELPVMVTLSFNEDGRTLFGSDAKTAMVVLQSLGADAVGVNCSTGPEQMVALVEDMKAYANIPVIAKPNAGMPEIIDGETVYRMSPEEFASDVSQLLEAGAGILGGCCGTTPEHIRALKEMVRERKVPEISGVHRRVLASERQTLDIELDGPFLVVGERINPTGKKKLQAALREGEMDRVMDMAIAQEEKGAAILDINMGMNGIDEKEMMLKSIEIVTQAVNLPLCIDSSHVDIIEAALRVYPGRALINSISLEKEKFERLLPLARKYGAMFILLPLSDEGLPKDMDEKIQIIHTIMDRALELGCHKEDIIVDGLVATVGANKQAAIDTLNTITYCHDTLGLATVCGLSNISFGLPERANVNTAFLTMAISRGLTMAIANPSQDMLMNAAFSADLLLNKPQGDVRYIERMNAMKAGQESESAGNMAENRPSAGGNDQNPQNVSRLVFEAVLKGNQSGILKLVKEGLAHGLTPDGIIETSLIPAIQKVGDLFEQQKYYLPQLIASAETMEKAIDYLEPLLAREDAEEKATVIMATVEGDIHDIGKNLVVLMLKNYGYRVIDLGKDVSKERIVAAAMEEKAAIIGLSALMTTTMMRMREVIEYARQKGCSSQIIIGGAVTTQSFADEIGADGYSKDAAEAVHLVERLLDCRKYKSE